MHCRALTSPRAALPAHSRSHRSLPRPAPPLEIAPHGPTRKPHPGPSLGSHRRLVDPLEIQPAVPTQARRTSAALHLRHSRPAHQCPRSLPADPAMPPSPASPAPAFLSPAPLPAPALNSALTPTPKCPSKPRAPSRCPRPCTPRMAAPPDAVAPAVPNTPASTRTYDYIIVGGGAAGCVLANRLTEDPTKSVLLLEAGPHDTTFYLSVPLGFPYLLGSARDWAFVTEPEPHLANRRLYFPRGKLLGGSHAISVMLYHRGHASDYRLWESLGAESWGPDDVLPYFLRAEAQRGHVPNRNAHGYDGPLAVSDLARLNPMSAAFLDAAHSAAGLRRNPDFNDWSDAQLGVGPFQVTQRDGVRESPATSYLQQARSRSNLTIETGAVVERIHFEQTDGASAAPAASAVSFVDRKGQRHRVSAAGEIVLAAGVYASPQLLMLSGVGPADHLRELGIPIVADVPAVGKNLQDHPAAMVSFESKHPQDDKRRSAVYYTERTGKNVGTFLNYLFRGKGPLTSPMCEAGGFVKTDDNLDSADLQLRFIPFVSEPDPYHSLAAFATGGSYLQNTSNRPAGFTLQSVAARPRSRGRVDLRSTDVRDSMRIHGNWMSNEQDMKTLLHGVKLCREIGNDGHLSEYRGRELHPGGDNVTDEDIENYIRETCHTANAMVGTCRMGTGEDAAVDTQLRVKGVSRLRVIDSSVMPTLPGGQSGAPTMMIAERGADFLRQAAKNASAVAATAGAA